MLIDRRPRFHEGKSTPNRAARRTPAEPLAQNPSLAPAPFLAALLLAGLTACSTERPTATSFSQDNDNPPVTAAAVLNEDFSSRQIFPVDNWWNQDVSMAPLDDDSDAIITWINNPSPANPNRRQRLHPDFGPPPYGMPYIAVDGTQARVPVTFVLYGSQSDAGAPGFPSERSTETAARFLGRHRPGPGRPW